MYVEAEIVQVIDVSGAEPDKMVYGLKANFLDIKLESQEQARELATKLNETIKEYVRN